MSEARALLTAYRGIVCDLDGVVYRGALAVEHAVAALEGARDRTAIVFATNNASRTAVVIREQLRGLGLTEPQVITSAEAGAHLIADEFGTGTAVLGVGGDGVSQALAAAGLRRVTSAGEAPSAILQGWGLQVSVADLAQAAIAVRAGAAWFVTNTDRTLPTAQGPIPGNGTLVAAVHSATGAVPRVVGKPEPPLYAAAAARLGLPASSVLAIGDRLETDVVGAQRAGLSSLWVLTGVDGFASLVDSTARPSFVAPDLRALHRPYPQVTAEATGGRWRVSSLQVHLDPAAAEPVLVAGSTEPTTDSMALAAWGLQVLMQLRDGHQAPADPALAARVGAQLDAILSRWRAAPDATA